MYTLVVIRHGESEWNKKNLFCGWTDVDLTENGFREAKEAGKLLKAEGFTFDKCYTSVLKRAIHMKWILSGFRSSRTTISTKDTTVLFRD